MMPTGRKLHYLKSWPTQFQAIKSGEKKFEWRINDRDYFAGDRLCLEEYNPTSGQKTGERMTVNVDYIMVGGFGLPDGYCIMSISPVGE